MLHIVIHLSVKNVGLLLFYKVDFSKYTIFKKTIQQRSEDGIILTLKTWNKEAEEKGHFLKKNIEIPEITKQSPRQEVQSI